MYPNATNRTNLWFDKQENIFIIYIFTRSFIEEIFSDELFRIPLSDPIPPHSTILFFQNFLLWIVIIPTKITSMTQTKKQSTNINQGTVAKYS